ncbi:Hypothetical predicted protein [Paramuricea clavata]|uniref:Uncharacterized protein n=1 Tax=Paramuricea clavata TaxID=317549 RepID=A0A7D9LYS5_PARCT|nr:Hypothetical predicted protein [Paramuricea clavata]
MADRHIFTSSVFLLSFVLFIGFRTLGLSSDLFYKAHSSTIHVFGEENRQIKREYQRFLTVDVDELRNDDEQTQSRTYFVALNNPKENGSFGYYYGKVHLLTMYMSEDSIVVSGKEYS